VTIIMVISTDAPIARNSAVELPYQGIIGTATSSCQIPPG
jgi:hypothetical protein